MEERGSSLIVIDSSAIGPLIFDDEAGDMLPGLAEELASGTAVVPVHWRIEVISALNNAMRRGRIEARDRDRGAKAIVAAELDVDAETAHRLWPEGIRLVDRHSLTIYDAAYLELALRRKLPLATLDSALIRAATAESVPLFGR